MVYESLFDQQVATLLDKRYPEHAGISESEFTAMLTPLRDKLADKKLFKEDLEQGKLPFVIVITDALISVRKRMELIERQGKNGFEKLDPKTPEDFHPIASVTIPEAKAYLITDIDRGKESLNVRPEDALAAIQQEKRSPLTIDEGIAVLTHYPDFLMKNNCFSLLASRCGDQKVPALWISEGKPKLGWCWDRNPHTWLGSASCQNRLI